MNGASRDLGGRRGEALAWGTGVG